MISAEWLTVEGFARLSRIALNLLKAEKTHTGGIKTNRLCCGWDHDYLLKVLAGGGFRCDCLVGVAKWHCSPCRIAYNDPLRGFEKTCSRKGKPMADKVNDTGLLSQVKAVIEHIRPLLQADGGDIELVGVDEPTGTVSVRLQGACRGCPSAAMTLKMGVERHLKEKVPAVRKLVSVE